LNNSCDVFQGNFSGETEISPVSLKYLHLCFQDEQILMSLE